MRQIPVPPISTELLLTWGYYSSTPGHEQHAVVRSLMARKNKRIRLWEGMPLIQVIGWTVLALHPHHGTQVPDSRLGEGRPYTCSRRRQQTQGAGFGPCQLLPNRIP